jgi:hypothetical protein
MQRLPARTEQQRRQEFIAPFSLASPSSTVAQEMNFYRLERRGKVNVMSPSLKLMKWSSAPSKRGSNGLAAFCTRTTTRTRLSSVNGASPAPQPTASRSLLLTPVTVPGWHFTDTQTQAATATNERP